MSDYGISATPTAGFADTVERTRAALAEQGFGILTEIDVAATMKTKLDVDMAPYLSWASATRRWPTRLSASTPPSGCCCPATSSSAASTTPTPWSRR
jgi:hypothetical protein